jgi:SlyX protein
MTTPPENTGHAARLTELEVKLSFVDDAVNALSFADAEQSQRLLAIERALHELRNEVSAVRTALGNDARAEPLPPHY